MELSFLYFLYKISDDGKKMIEFNDVIPLEHAVRATETYF